MGGGISGVGSVNYTFARQNEPANKTVIGDNLSGIKNIDDLPGRLSIKQASVTDILSFISSDKMQWRENCTVKVVNNDETSVINAAPQRAEETNAGEAASVSADASFKQGINKALHELPSDEEFISQKQHDAREDLIASHKEANNKTEEKKFQKFISMITHFSGQEEHRAVRCVNDFLMIRKEVKDSLQPEDSAKRSELDKLTSKFISIVSKNGLGIDSLAAGSMKSSESKLNKFRSVCNRLVGLSRAENGRSDLTFNHQISDKIATAIFNSGLSAEQQKQVLDKSSDLFRASQAEHKDMHSSISGAPLSPFEQVQNRLHHESIIFDLLNHRLAEMADNAPAADGKKQDGPAAGPGAPAQPGQTIYNVTIDNSIHANINGGMNASEPAKADNDVNFDKTPVNDHLTQTDGASPHHSQHVQTETEHNAATGTQAGEGLNPPVTEEPFTRQFAKVNTATIPSVPAQEPGAEVTPDDETQQPQPVVQPAVEPRVNSAMKDSWTEPQAASPAPAPYSQPSTAGSDVQAQPVKADKATSAGSEQAMGVKPEMRTAGQQTAKAVKHPTVDASTSYFGSPGSSGARSTPSDAGRNKASGNSGVGVGRGAQTVGLSSQPSTAGSDVQAQPVKADKATFAGSEQAMGVKPEMRTAGQQTAKAVKHPTVDASTSYFGSPGSSGARSTPLDAGRNKASGNSDVGVGRGAQTPGASAQAATNAGPAVAGNRAFAQANSTSQKNISKETVQASIRTEAVSRSSTLSATVTQQATRDAGASNKQSAKYPPVETTNSYFGSPGSSGARSVPSDSVREKGKAGIGRETQTVGVESAKVAVQTQGDIQGRKSAVEQRAADDRGMKAGAQTHIGQHAMMQASPLINSAQVHATVQKATAETVVGNVQRNAVKPEAGAQSVAGAKNQPAKKHPPVNMSRSYLGSPGSSGARAVPSDFAGVNNPVRGGAAGRAAPDKNAAIPKQSVDLQNTAKAASQHGAEARAHTAPQNLRHQPAKKHPPVGATNGYLGGPGSSAAPSVPSSFARDRKASEPKVAGSGANSESADASFARESRQSVNSQNVSNTVSQRPATGHKMVGATQGQRVVAQNNSDLKFQKDGVQGGQANKGPRAQTYMDRQNQGYIGSRGSAQATPFFNGPANKK
ncbi:Uncharacterised protein [Cedecea davisae]|uniref:TrwC relaxase n=1 Tax=Cedecea davisae DSM 4568 TaxID=566551 RepID=S3IMD2_9ENTR|nr:TrwC relaxase [Cedecea davisae]EPF14988.1 TrwC relaxase [Cedecea davisae DSM 4568]SUX38017.1 Uncharacterised protein [Cedecea davisae]